MSEEPAKRGLANESAAGDGEQPNSGRETTVDSIPSSAPQAMRFLPIMPLMSGGMAHVQLAVGTEASNFKKLVVLKSLREEFAVDPVLVEMFLNEARLCARLNHSNLVQVYEVMERPKPCLVMEYLEGLSFFELHRHFGSDFDIAIQLRIISDVLAGLHYAHELCDYDGTALGIIHRDVSPQNVFVTSEGRVKVLDFGIAKVASAPSYTQAGIVKGKMSYLSPEQLAGTAVDRRVDIYAVGCMLWRAASGRKLWSKVSPEEIMRSLISGEIPRPSIHRDVDPRLEAIVMKALAPNREQRYETAVELRAAIDELLVEMGPGTELQDWMTETFQQEWLERRRAIHNRLSEATSIPPVERTRVSIVAPSYLPERDRNTKAYTIGAVAVAVGILLAGTIGWISRLDAGANRHDALPERAVPDPSEVLVHVRVEPTEARITIDGRARSENPIDVRLASDRDHAIDAELPGYRSSSRLLRFNRDSSVEFVLTPEPASAPTHAAPAIQRPAKRLLATPKPSASAPPTAPHSNSPGEDACAVPFYYLNGIKTYRPECL